MEKPRRHHYCPAAYLANFALPNKRDGKILVTSKDSGLDRPSTPNNEAHQRDFYRIETQDEKIDPFGLEKEFSTIESPALAGIRKAINSNKLPSDEDMSWIINFIGLLAVRVPSRRNRWAGFMESIYKKVLRMQTSSEERYISTLKNIEKSENINHINMPSYSEIKKIAEDDELKITLHQNEHIISMLHMADTVISLLFNRNWSLVIADSEMDFITSDNPVVLRWIKQPKKWISPGFRLKNTEVSITLSPKHALVGVYEEIDEALAVSDFGVAAMNKYLHIRADRWLYSKLGNPVTIGPDQNIIRYKDRLVKVKE